MRRTLILSGIAVLIVLLVGAYVFFFTGFGGRETAGNTNEPGFFGSLFPFNFGNAPETPPLIDGNTETPVDTRPVPRLRKISETPVGGGFFFVDKEGQASTTVGIRYIERTSGHVYETSATSFTTRRISNTTIPGIQEVLWEDKNNFLIRYLDNSTDIETYAIGLVDADVEQSITGKQVTSFERGSLNSTGATLVSVSENANGSTVYTGPANGQSRTSVFSSPITSWIPHLRGSTVYLTSAPSASVTGFLYRLSGQSLIKVLGGERGLMVSLSPTGAYALISTVDDAGGIGLSVVALASGERRASPVDTISTKCGFVSEKPLQVVCGVPVEFPRASYPTDWLLGRVSFSDDVWLIDFDEGSAELLVLAGEDTTELLDVTHVIVDETASYAGFINKNDLSFWALRLEP